MIDNHSNIFHCILQITDNLCVYHVVNEIETRIEFVRIKGYKNVCIEDKILMRFRNILNFIWN